MKHRKLERRLRAVREVAPSSELAARLERGIPDSPMRPGRPGIPGRIWTMAKIGAPAAAAVTALAWLAIGVLVGPGSTGAVFATVLEPVARATAQTEAIHVILRMLSREGEDFSYVNLEGELEPVEVWIRMPRIPGDPGRARIDKPDRIYAFDGDETVFYHPRRREAHRAPGSHIDFDLIWPAAWVRQVQNMPTEGVEVLARQEDSGLGRLLIREKGADSTLSEPSFLGDFERETEIEWDLGTLRLTNLRRWIYHDGERRLFSELSSIDYLPAIDDARFRIELPQDVRWSGVGRGPAQLTEMGPREVALRIFEAARDGDRAELELLCPSPSMVDRLLDRRHGPAEILFIGEPFHSGTYPGVYVPYRVRFGSDRNEVKEHNLALKKSTEHDRWIFDGGI